MHTSATSTSLRRLFCLLLCLCGLTVNGAAQPELARKILDDPDLAAVALRAKALMATGFNAGDGYGEIWIRDFNTFMDLACAVHPKETVREKLELFFHFQGEDGNIVDGYIPKAQASVGYDFIYSDSAPEFAAHKNTVETDQESSLVLGVCRYVRATGDRDFLLQTIRGRTVTQRLEDALRFVRTARFDAAHGLVWGGTTADWGDVQPEHPWGVVLDENSHRALDIYDNALYLTAIDAFLDAANDLPNATRQEWTTFRHQVAANVRAHLWDHERKKFIPHVYLEGSPFPDDFDENVIYYHGGTAVAIEAELLSHGEVGEALQRMIQNVRDAGAASIGLTMYPAYPQGFFKNPSMAVPYSYQNGGDWAWFGGRMIQQLVRHGYAADAYRELQPMLRQVLDHDGFYEWFTRENQPRGSGSYRGAAGVLYQAIVMLQEWASKEIQSEDEKC